MLLGKFLVKELLGKGSFGQIYRCVYKKTGQEVACKIERNSEKSSSNTLNREAFPFNPQAKFMWDLSEEEGFPKLLFYQKCADEKLSVMAMPIYGANLEYRYYKCKYTFTLKTVLLLAV